MSKDLLPIRLEAGAAIFFPKVVGGVVPRRKWLLVGGFVAPTAMVLLFHAPQGSVAQLGLITLIMGVMVFAGSPIQATIRPALSRRCGKRAR